MPSNLAKRLGGHIKGSRFSVTLGNLNVAALDTAANLFCADKACKLIEAVESHGTVCDAADVLNLEKCASGEDLAAGGLLLGTGWTLNSTANTPVSRAAVTTAVAVLAKGDRVCARMTTGDGTLWAEGVITLTFEYI